MKASETFESPEKFAAHLRKLRGKRANTKMELREGVSRKPPNAALREEILYKTGGMCHICGGKIKGVWHADHVFSHSRGGKPELANYLPAHPTCNSYRKAFDPEEMQWILKLGVWLKTQIEKETELGRDSAEAFCKNDRKRADRRVQPKP